MLPGIPLLSKSAGGGGSPVPPPGVVRGVYCFSPATAVIPANILTNPNIKGVSVGFSDWGTVKPTQFGTPNWSQFDAVCAQVAAAGKKIYVRFGCSGNSVTNGARVSPPGGRGTIPDWVFDLLVGWHDRYDIVPGVTFTFNDTHSFAPTVRCIPVPYNATFLALKVAHLTECWAHVATLSTAIKNAISHTNVQLLECQHFDWSVPNSNTQDTTGGPDWISNSPGTGYDRTDTRRWTDSVGAGGAGYTSAAMLDQMKQQYTAIYNGVQSALGRTIPMFSCIGLNPQGLDAAAAAAEVPPYIYPNLWLTHALYDWANSNYPGTIMLANEGVAACHMQGPPGSAGGIHWFLVQNAIAGGLNGGQMLAATHTDGGLTNNGGTLVNCKQGINPRYPNAMSTAQDVNDQCADNAGPTSGYSMAINEFYEVDCDTSLASPLDQTYAKNVLDP